MKAKLLPLYFTKGRNEEFDDQLAVLKRELSDIAEFMDEVSVGDKLTDCDAVIFPQLVGDAYKEIDDLIGIEVPILAVTSEFGTVAMWDWEIVTYLKSKGLKAFAPYSMEMTKMLIKIIAAKKELQGSKFLVFQDDPGEGMQASIFKRFYWWEDECTKTMLEKFGVQVVKKSLKVLGQEAKNISDEDAKKALEQWEIPTRDLSDRALLSAMKMYVKVKQEIEVDKKIIGAGMNCLNESFYSDTTPCLTWNLLFEEKDLLWACEGDTVSLLTKYLIYKTTGHSVMMSNLYPFLMGDPALQHEKITTGFPKVDEPENSILVAHCGYFGLLPKCYSCSWNLTKKVLGIVDDNAVAIDGKMAEGKMTLTQLHPSMDKMLMIDAELTGYEEYPGTDCLVGGILRVNDGHELMSKLYSHHAIISQGHIYKDMKFVAEVFDMQIDRV